MSLVAVNPPKTPVTKGSNGLATATVPNVCKMPGPPAPFVPTPLPNIGKSGSSPDGYSTSVTIEGDAVAIQGASFGSMGDVASKGTGGGIVSNNVEGPTKFVAPGSLDVKIEGKNVQLLGDQMVNNGGPGGSPPNAATMPGELQGTTPPPPPFRTNSPDCETNKKPAAQGGKDWDDCDVKQLCAKVRRVNELRRQDALTRKSQSSSPAYKSTKSAYYASFARACGAKTQMSEAFLKDAFYHECAREKWEKAGRNPKPNSRSLRRRAFQADHIHDSQLGCNLKNIINFKMLSQSVNGSIGPVLKAYDPAKSGEIVLLKCDCTQK